MKNEKQGIPLTIKLEISQFIQKGASMTHYGSKQLPIKQNKDQALCTQMRRSSISHAKLFDFLMSRVLITMAAELFQFQPSRCIAAVLFGGVPGNPRRPLIRVGPTLRTL